MSLPSTVVADPPWWPTLHANTVGRTRGAYRAGPQRYYKLMKLNEIIACRPETQKKAHLWLDALTSAWAKRRVALDGGGES